MQPRAQATDHATPSRAGAHLQGTLRLKSRPTPMSWDGCQAGGQSRALRPGVWPRLPPHGTLTATPLAGRNPGACLMALPAWPGHPWTLPGGPNNGTFCSVVPLSPILSPACARAKGGFPEGFLNGRADKHPVSRARRSPPGPEGHTAGAASGPLEVAQTGGAVLHGGTGLYGHPQGPVRETTKTSGLNHG